MAMFTRKIDDLGRVSIPKEVRKMLGWNSQDEIAMEFTQDNKIILSKYFPDYESYLVHVRDLLIADQEIENRDEKIAAIQIAIKALRE